ncbi:hypothetical protein EAE96_007895 [Botrytis aclada]|nr:hypothetical protein EAE96_007895 [Botrytis aclada]
MSFSMLPPELRNLIWEFALPGPRSHIVETSQTIKKKKIPLVLQINQESREFALKLMPVLFDGTNVAGCDNCQFTYFNSKIDTLRFPGFRDTSERFDFFMGPRYPRRILGRPAAPVKECDMVKSIEISGWMPYHKCFELNKTGYFRNLERLVVRQQPFENCPYQLSSPGPADRAQAYIIIHEMTWKAIKYYEFFEQQVKLGNIAAIPDIVFIFTKADARLILSTGASTLDFSGTRAVMNKAVENMLIARRTLKH